MFILDSVRLAGAFPSEIEEALAHPLVPERAPREESIPPEPVVPPLPHQLERARWADVAPREASRVAIDEASVDEDIRRLIRQAATVSSPVREELFSEIGLRTDDGVSAHLRDLWNQAIDGQPYDPKQDRSGQMMAEIDHAVRRVPAVKRPRPVRFSIQAVAQHPRRCSAWLQWIEDGEPRLIGPFLTARALVTSVKARTRRLREQARRDGVIAPP